MILARACASLALGALLVSGVAAELAHTTPSATPTVQLASFSSSPGDDIKDVGKCAYQVVGAKVAKQAGKSIWGKLKQRKLPNLKDLGSTAASAAATGLADSNPYIAGAMIVGCSVWSADPAG